MSEQMFSMEAEAAVLGSLLLDNRAFDHVGSLKPEHFAGPGHQTIFAAIHGELAANRPADVITVFEALGDKAEAAGGLVYLQQLAQYIPSAGNIRRYAEVIIDRFDSRQLLSVSGEIAELAQDQTQPAAVRVEQAQAQLSRLVKDAPREDWVGAYEGMVAHSQILDQRANGQLSAWPTGLDDLDEYLEGGLRPGNLVIVGARPSMGKTALGLTIGVSMARSLPVAMLSMEMSHSEVNDRLTAMLGNVSMTDVKRPNRGAGLQWDRVMEGVDKAKQLRLHVSDQGGLTINHVRTKARNAKRLHGLDVLVVDYIGLMTGLDPKANRNTQLGEISRGLKTLAKELQMCVLCLAQLNRKAEERPDQMPQMADLRDSGEIEQDADVILFIKRPIMANPDLGPEWAHYAKVSVAKNRQGRCGYLDLSYLGEQTRFAGWSGPAPRKESTNQRGGNL
jgi:replicative DNA helicase